MQLNRTALQLAWIDPNFLLLIDLVRLGNLLRWAQLLESTLLGKKYLQGLLSEILVRLRMRELVSKGINLVCFMIFDHKISKLKILGILVTWRIALWVYFLVGWSKLNLLYLNSLEIESPKLRKKVKICLKVLKCSHPQNNQLRKLKKSSLLRAGLTFLCPWKKLSGEAQLNK